ncbi:ureidoglycolate hydrolase, partial [Usnea florida]
VNAVPLTPSAFAPFGDVFTSPLPSSTTTPPSSPPHGSIAANQGTALKFADIAPITSIYHTSPSGTPARPSMSLFSCFPRALRASTGQQIFDVQVLERHPYTTQTFIPLASTAVNTAKSIIIVAPTLPAPPPPPPSPPALTPYFPQLQSKKAGLPDLRNLKAFVAEPGMSVTYAVGIWHAPMVVVGGRVDFVVVQHLSGKGDEDCQE